MFTHHRITSRAKTTAVACLAALALSVGLSACGDDTQSADSAAPSEVQTAGNGDVFNGADVQFATNMIPHHAQAIEMVSLTDGRPLDPEVKAIADAIRDAQGPEVETMVDWLTAWDQEVPETSLDHANADHDMGEMDGMDGDSSSDASGMPGMMSEDEMASLAAASDEEFQDLWLEMMIEHHTGAIEMAKAEQEDGEFADAVALAESIEAAQADEIARMQALLGS